MLDCVGEVEAGEEQHHQRRGEGDADLARPEQHQEHREPEHDDGRTGSGSVKSEVTEERGVGVGDLELRLVEEELLRRLLPEADGREGRSEADRDHRQRAR